MKVSCAQCSVAYDCKTGAYNRAMKAGANLYCSRTCAGLARRAKNPLSEEERKAKKAKYDLERRAIHGDRIRKQKMDAYYANHEEALAKAKIYRKKRMPKHVEYCRQESYKAKKKAYDADRRFKAFGPFEEVARILDQVEKEISSQASRYDIYKAKGYFTRSAIQRRRELWQLIKRN